MAQQYKKFQIQGTASTGSYVTLYTTPSQTEAMISTILVCNTSASPVTIRIGMDDGVGTPDSVNGEWLIYDLVIDANDTVTFSLGVTMQASKYIRVSSSNIAANFTAFVMEVPALPSSAYWTQNGSDLYYTSGNVGIGTSSPSSLFNVASDISTSVYFEQYTNDANGPSLTLDKGRGIETSPVAILADDKLGLIQFAGWSTGGQRLGCAAIQSFASQNWSLNSGGAYITFSTSPDGGTAYQERMRIDSAGNVGIGTSTIRSWDAARTALQIGGQSSIMTTTAAQAGAATIYLNGVYYDGAAWKYTTANEEGSGVELINGQTIFYSANSTSHAADANATFNEVMRIDSAGKVGIGNTAPSSYTAASFSSLVVGNDTTSTNNGISIITNPGYGGALSFGDGTGDPAQHQGIIYYVHSSDSMYLYTANTARILINGSGVVNIPNLTASSDVQTDGSKNLISVSDRRLKDDFGTMADGSLSIINQITPHYFKYKSDVANGVDALQLGFYAQEIHPLIPEAAPCSPAMVPSLDADGVQILDEDGHVVLEDSGDVIWGFNSRPIQAHLVKAIQELTAQVETLQAQVAALQGE